VDVGISAERSARRDLPVLLIVPTDILIVTPAALSNAVCSSARCHYSMFRYHCGHKIAEGWQHSKRCVRDWRISVRSQDGNTLAATVMPIAIAIFG
jgi:hypothetical protein